MDTITLNPEDIYQPYGSIDIPALDLEDGLYKFAIWFKDRRSYLPLIFESKQGEGVVLDEADATTVTIYPVPMNNTFNVRCESVMDVSFDFVLKDSQGNTLATANGKEVDAGTPLNFTVNFTPPTPLPQLLVNMFEFKDNSEKSILTLCVSP